MRVLGEVRELSHGIQTLMALARLAFAVAEMTHPEAKSTAYWSTHNDTDDGEPCFSFTVNYYEDK